MATLRELADAGAISKYEPALSHGRQPERLFYASPRLTQWIGEVLPSLESDLGVELTPNEQVAALLEEFCAGTELAYGRHFRDLRPVAKGIWEFKTPDIRVFGWFPHRDHFLGYAADTANRIKDHDLYAGYRDEAVRFRDQLALDEPKFVPGRDPHAVVSNYYFP